MKVQSALKQVVSDFCEALRSQAIACVKIEPIACWWNKGKMQDLETVFYFTVFCSVEVSPYL